MYPYFFNIIDSYVVMLLLGVFLCFVLVVLYFKKLKKNLYFILDLILCAIVAVIVGIIFACLFENLYEFALNPSIYNWTWGMTFYGGLFGGVLGFLLMYFLYFKKRNGQAMNELLIIAPAAITLAHGIGRIGCFLSGCCYGKETDSIIGIKFPSLDHKVIPTQLFEAIFLLILATILITLIFTINFKYTFVIYTVSYSIFRFIIEFFRGDFRGAFLGIFSPSQIWCFALFLISIPLYFLLKLVIFKSNKNE